MAESEIRAKLVFQADKASAAQAGKEGAKLAAEGASKVSGEEQRRIFSAVGTNTASQANATARQVAAATGQRAISMAQSRAAQAMWLARQQPGYGSSAATGLQAFINQSLGVGAGQNRPGAGYASFWQQSVPPLLKQQAAGLTGGGWPPRGLSALSASGIPYFSTLARAIFTPFGAAIAGLATTVLGLNKAMQDARHLYAKSLTSGGLPFAFVAQRSAIASVLGVGEREVFHFGQSVSVLAGKLHWASKTMAETVRTNTMVAWNFKVAWENVSASFSTLVDELSPMLNKIAEMTSKAAQGTGEAVKTISEAVRAQMEKGSPAAEFAKQWGLEIKDRKPWEDKSVPIWRFQSTGGVDVSAKVMEKYRRDFSEQIKLIWNKDKAPPAEAFANRYKTSPWERMGLVLGSIGNSPMQETAKNTRKMVTLLERLAGPRSGSRDSSFRLGAQAGLP